MSKIEQYVMAYRGDWDRIKSLLPEGFESLRPVLRLNVEIITEGDGGRVRIEFNTPVAARGKRGWLNLTVWGTEAGTYEIPECTEQIQVKKSGGEVKFLLGEADMPLLDIDFKPVGVEGGCPKEDDNDGMFYLDMDGQYQFKPAEVIDEKKEYCDCALGWNAEGEAAAGIGELIKRATAIPVDEVLGAYVVTFRGER